MASRVHVMETSSRNKMYRAHVRNGFETHHLAERIGTLERGKVAVLETHLRRTLEVKDTIRASRKTSGRSREATPCDARTSAQLAHALQTRSAPWCYFGSATLETWSGAGGEVQHTAPLGRPRTAEASLSMRGTRRVRPAPIEGDTGGDAGSGTRQTRVETPGGKVRRRKASGEEELEEDSSRESLSAAPRSPKVVPEGHTGRGDESTIVVNPGPQSSIRHVYQNMVTQLPPDGSATNHTAHSITTRRSHHRKCGQQTSALGNLTFRAVSAPRGRHVSDASDITPDHDVIAGSPRTTTGCDSPFSEVSIAPPRPLSRARGTSDPEKRASPEKRSELVTLLKLSEAPSTTRGPKVKFDPSVKGVPDKYRLGSKVRVTFDSDSESDVDLSKVEKRLFDPASVLPRKKAARVKSASARQPPELQFYVRPQERHRTEHMFMMKKRHLLSRNLKVAKDPPPSGTPGQLPVEVSATSSRMCRERALVEMVEAHVAAARREAHAQRMSQRLGVQAKVGAFLTSISNFLIAQA